MQASPGNPRRWPGGRRYYRPVTARSGRWPVRAPRRRSWSMPSALGQSVSHQPGRSRHRDGYRVPVTRPSGGMADATDSKSVVRKGVWVRVPPRAPKSEPAQRLDCRAGRRVWSAQRSVIQESSKNSASVRGRAGVVARTPAGGVGAHRAAATRDPVSGKYKQMSTAWSAAPSARPSVSCRRWSPVSAKARSPRRLRRWMSSSIDGSSPGVSGCRRRRHVSTAGWPRRSSRRRWVRCPSARSRLTSSMPCTPVS